MFKSISNVPIFRRLFIAFALAVVTPSIVVVLLGTFYYNALTARSAAVTKSFDAQNAATDEELSLSRMNALLQARFAQRFALHAKPIPPDDATLAASGDLETEDINGLTVVFAQKLVDYKANYEIATSDNMSGIRNILLSNNPNEPVIGEQQQTLDLVVNTQWNTYQTNQNKVMALLQGPSNADTYVPDYRIAYKALFDADASYLTLKNSWLALVTNATTVGSSVTNISAPSFTTPLLIFTTTALLLIVLIIVGSGYVVNATITQPLRQLVVLTKRIANGETDARAQIKGRDEIYAVASSMNNMLEYTVRLVREAQERHTALQTQIEKLVNEVSGVGEGDLSIQAEVTTDELGVLADSFNYMTEELSNLVVRVKTLSHEVESATITSFDRMAQLVQGADLQIQQIVTAAVEVGEMATSSRNVAERSQVLTEIALTARQTAQGGRGAMQQTVAGIRRIERNVKSTAEKVQVLGERSREINDIVKVISSIAHQTNRLALDAAIQAAMAGENGKGFGAVASDIRRLAERSKEQTLMIGQIVYSVLEDISSAASAMSDTERETTSGTHLIEEAGQALDSIFSVVEQQASEISTINQVAMKQLQSSNAVVHIMQNVSDSTQQSNTSTREVSAQMEHVAQLAEQLLTSVDVFKVREGRAPQLAAAARSDVRVIPVPNQSPYGRLSYNTPMQISGRVSQTLQQEPSTSEEQFNFYPPNTPYPTSAFQQPSTPRPNQDEYQQQYNNNGQQYNNGNSNGNGQQYNNGNSNGNGQQYNNGNSNSNGQQYNNGNSNSNGQQYNNGNSRNRP